MIGLLSLDFVILPVLARTSTTRSARASTLRREEGASAHLRLVKEPPVRAPLDVAVISRAVHGDEQAFAALVRWYHPRFLRFAQHMLRSETEADDVVQEAFIRVYRALPRYQDYERFESWLFRILANCCRTALSRSRRQALRMIGLETDAAREIHARVDTRDDAAWRTLLVAALETLPTEQREAFLLHYVEGHSYEAMADVTGARPSALKMRVKRACDKLRAYLGETADA